MSWEPWLAPDEPEPKESDQVDCWGNVLYVGEEVQDYDGQLYRSEDLYEFADDFILRNPQTVLDIVAESICDNSWTIIIQE